MSNLAEVLEYGGWKGERFSEILILDDSEFDRKRLRRAMGQLPMAFNFTEAEDFGVFEHHLRAKRFDIILVDFALADGDGLQAPELIRKAANNRDALIVMVTGNDSSALAVSALKCGFDDYLSKDEVTQDVLSGFLSAAMDKRRQTSNVLHFPLAPSAHAGLAPSEGMHGMEPALLCEALEPVLRSTLETVASRIRIEEMGDTIVALIGSFEDPDEFIFR